MAARVNRESTMPKRYLDEVLLEMDVRPKDKKKKPKTDHKTLSCRCDRRGQDWEDRKVSENSTSNKC